MGSSLAEQMADLPESERIKALARFTPEQQIALLHDWRGFLARPDQIAPDGDWSIWLALAGRGWGKTEVGARWVKEQVALGVRKIALVAETQKDLEEVMLARIIAIHQPDEMPVVRYKPVRIEWPNGAIALGYNGTSPEQLRGPEFESAWVDELAKYRYARETWDMLQFCMRAGVNPRQCITTTPRPIELIKEIMAGREGKVHVTRGRTMDNKSNLAKTFMEKIQNRYAGTRLGRQELDAEVLGDLPGALWHQAQIDMYRLSKRPNMERVVVGVDPAVTNTEDSDYHGIVVAGITEDKEGVLLDDRSIQGSPMAWARAACAAAREYGASHIVAEVNQGGDMVVQTIRSVDPNMKVKTVRASKGKEVRAVPIAGLYEQGRIRHVGNFAHLENEFCQFTSAGYEGENSPDRADAAIWAMHDLFPHVTRKILPNAHPGAPAVSVL